MLAIRLVLIFVVIERKGSKGRTSRIVAAGRDLVWARRFRVVRSLHSGGGNFTSKRRRRVAEFFAAAEVSQKAMRRANHAL